MLPIDAATLELRCGGVAAIGDSERAADSITAFGEVQPVANIAADAVVGHPLQERGIDASLKNKVLQQAADIVVGKRADQRCPHSKAAAQPAGHIVFAAAFPCAETSGGTDSSFARIQAKHHFTK
jgi:hypothetical protein